MSCPNLNVLILRHLLKYQSYSSKYAWGNVRHLTSTRRYTSYAEEKITLPKPIPKGPTDVLEALATTVKRDPTAAHYKFHDDPFLIPVSNNAKRSYALAQEAGRKAAKWIKEEHADLFQHRHAEPFIQAFAPAEKLTDSTPMTEELLLKYIKSFQVKSAIFICEKLGIEALSPSTKQALLELLCFYNQEDPLDEDLIEERWFRAGMKGKDQPKVTWKNSGLGEKVFNSIEPKTPEAYCALICGMAKYGQVSGAWEHYSQMHAQGMAPNLQTFNSIFRIIGSIKESGELQMQFVEETLTNMNRLGLKPTVETLNAILSTVSRMPIYRMAREKALQIVADFKSIEIMPSLGTYFYLLKTFCREKGPINNILINIVGHLEQGGVPPLQDIADTAFFSEAMRVCNAHLANLTLAKRLHDILVLPGNQVFIGDSYKEATYYRNFMQLVIRSETPEGMMEMYHKLVPNIYTPEQSIFESILKSLKDVSATQYVPELWSDAVFFDFAEKDSIVEAILQALASGDGPRADNLESAEEGYVEPVLKTAQNIWNHIEEVLNFAQQSGRPVNMRWTATMLGNLVKVYLQYGDIESANQAMAKLNSVRGGLTTFMPSSIVERFFDVCIARKDSAMALLTLDYATDSGFSEASTMAERIAKELELDTRQQTKFESIQNQIPHRN